MPFGEIDDRVLGHFVDGAHAEIEHTTTRADPTTIQGRSRSMARTRAWNAAPGMPQSQFIRTTKLAPRMASKGFCRGSARVQATRRVWQRTRWLIRTSQRPELDGANTSALMAKVAMTPKAVPTANAETASILRRRDRGVQLCLLLCALKARLGSGDGLSPAALMRGALRSSSWSKPFHRDAFLDEAEPLSTAQ